MRGSELERLTAIQVLRGRPATARAVPESLPIGLEEQEIFNCPVCARPLALGSRRCPACQTRLIRGVPAGKASLFIVSGLVVGLLAGAGGAAGYAAVSSATARPSTGGQGANSSTAPGTGSGATGGAGSSTPGASGTVSVSGIVSSSLQQAGAVNVKLADGAIALRSQLDSSSIDTAEIAMILRSIASNAQFGAEVAPRIGMWSAAGDLSVDLAAFYESVRETARAGLGISLTSAQGYRQAANDMIRTLRALKGLQSTATRLGATASIQIPVLPARMP